MFIRRDRREKRDTRETFSIKLFRLTSVLIVSFISLFTPTHNTFASKIAHTSPPALVVMPGDGIRPLEQIMSDAGKSLDVIMHRLDDQRILRAISKTAKRGVKVRVLLEKNPAGMRTDNDKARKGLESAGAFVEWAHPKFEQTFQKTIIVDKSAAYVSTFDFTDRAIDGARGFVIKLVDPREVSEIVKTFDADWSRKIINPVSANLAWTPTIARMKISDLLRNARHSLRIYSERIQDVEVVREIGNAIKRGVAAKVLVGDKSGNEPGVVSLRLLGARVRVLKKPELRANMILADAGHKGQVALIGSVDLESSSLDMHRGLSAFISDKFRLKELEKIFEKDWKNSSSFLKDKKLNYK